MDNVGGRARPLVIVASEAHGMADAWATHLVQAGWMALPARSPRGCLRLATALGPDAILVDDRFPSSIERLIGAHPNSSQARLFRLPALRSCPSAAPGLQLTDQSTTTPAPVQTPRTFAIPGVQPA